jgi:hypothetical protein
MMAQKQLMLLLKQKDMPRQKLLLPLPGRCVDVFPFLHLVGLDSDNIFSVYETLQAEQEVAAAAAAAKAEAERLAKAAAEKLEVRLRCDDRNVVCAHSPKHL